MNSKADKFILFKFLGKLNVWRVNDLDPQFLSHITLCLGCKKRILRPVKNIALCEKCKYRGKHCKAHSKCNNCEMLDKQNNCKCLSIKPGQPCPYFVRADKEEPPEFEVIKVADTNECFAIKGTIKDDLKPQMNFEGAIEILEKYQDLLPQDSQIAVDVIRKSFEDTKNLIVLKDSEIERLREENKTLSRNEGKIIKEFAQKIFKVKGSKNK